jgi:DNA-binding transcriptional ArsR family regulator
MTDDRTVTDDQLATESGEPARVRVIESADAIKALADPLRLRVLQLLMTTSERSWSVKEIGAELTQPVTKLYHHVKILEAAALIADVDTRVVSGIVEHRYRASQKSLRFDETLFGAPETRPDTIAQVAALVDTTRDDLVHYLERDDADIDHVTVSKATVRLTPEELEAVNATIDEMFASFSVAREDDGRAGVPRTSLLFLVHPLPHDPPS